MCLSERGCLFNLSEDDYERNDLSLVEVDKLNELNDILDSYIATRFHMGEDGYEDPNYTNCVTLEEKIEEMNGWAAPVCT